MPKWLPLPDTDEPMAVKAPSKGKWFKLMVLFVVSVMGLFSISYLGTEGNSISDFSQLAQGWNRNGIIPNTVHFIMMKRDPDAEFNLSFRYFLAAYAAHVNQQPDIMYMHVDFNETMMERAAEKGNKWTKMFLDPTKFPELKINYVKAASHANGMELAFPEHKSDFVRIDELHKKGGVYIDLDAYTLRDPAPLRESGFRAIVGREIPGKINNGVMMAQPGAELMDLMNTEQYVYYNGGYVSHSVMLLTDLAERLVRTPWAVLILECLAFAPSGFGNGDVKALYEKHDSKVPLNKGLNTEEEDPYIRWHDKQDKAQDWEKSWGASYYLHAFKRHDPKLMPYFDGMSVKYILGRDSNIGIALYDIVKQGVDDGWFDPNDTDL